MRTLFVVTLALGAWTIQAAEKKVQMKDLPAVVQQAIQAQTKGSQIKGLSKETEKGQTQYEVETVADGKSRDLTFDDKGTMIEVEQEIAMDSVPASARAGLEKQTAGGKITKVESVTRGGVTNYEAAYTKGGKSREAMVSAAGSPVKD